jgi:hypothetical protein
MNSLDAVERVLPRLKEEYYRRGWKMLPSIDRVMSTRRPERYLQVLPGDRHHETLKLTHPFSSIVN